MNIELASRFRQDFYTEKQTLDVLLCSESTDPLPIQQVNTQLTQLRLKINEAQLYLSPYDVKVTS